MSFAKHQAQGVNPVFVVWKWVTRTDDKGNAKLQRVGRAVVDNRPTNKNLVPDLYPLPGQDEIIALAKGKRFITIVDAAKFFYQWRIHPDYYGHQAVISHRGQEVLHVVAMGNSNSIAYVQRQMDNILRAFREWCRTYVDDIFAVGDTLDEHVAKLHLLFAKLEEFNITLDPKKARIGFPSLTLLGKDIDSAGMSTTAEKVKAITSLVFPRTCKQLETYLGMTGDLRHYIKSYAQKSEPLQVRKTNLLKGSPIKGPQRRAWSAQAILNEPSQAELESFRLLQAEFHEPKWLAHHDPTRQLYIDTDDDVHS
ncbi:hypothetical protein CBS147333_10369 [Penicillium roqueforti]|nr:hypothetical protein CBS147333_10369 [Penicillium roqueforti]